MMQHKKMFPVSPWRILYMRLKLVVYRLKPYKGMMAYEIQVFGLVFQWFFKSTVLRERWVVKHYWWPSEDSPKRRLSWRVRIMRFQVFYDACWWRP